MLGVGLGDDLSDCGFIGKNAPVNSGEIGCRQVFNLAVTTRLLHTHVRSNLGALPSVGNANFPR